jgi:threonine dehydrogenase-like Zn-dependent dehydrogenase
MTEGLLIWAFGHSGLIRNLGFGFRNSMIVRSLLALAAAFDGFSAALDLFAARAERVAEVRLSAAVVGEGTIGVATIATVLAAAAADRVVGVEFVLPSPRALVGWEGRRPG